MSVDFIPTIMRKTLWVVAGLLGIAVTGRSAEIHGKVTDPQGAGIAGVFISVQLDASPSGPSALTGPDGAYLLKDLLPGGYTLRARKSGYTEGTQGPVRVPEPAARIVVNFRLSPTGESEEVRGTEERNPNDFIIQLDTNAIQNELSRTGTNLRFFPEFRADPSYYGEQFGFLLRRVERAVAARPLGEFHGSVYEFHQNGRLNARPFFQVGALRPSRRNQYGFSVSGPIRPQKLSFQFAWGQVRDSGFVNGNVQVPLAQERQPRSSDPELNAIIAALLKAFPPELPNLPQVSVRHLNTNALRDIRNTAFSLHLDYEPASGDRVAYQQQFLDSTEEPFELVIGQNPRTLLRPQSYRLSYLHSFSSNTVSQIGLNYERLRVLLLPTKRFEQLLAPLGIPEPPDIELGEELTNLGIPGQGIPRRRFENHFLLSGQLTHTQAAHAHSFGFGAKYLRDSDLRSSNARGQFTIGNDFGRTAVQNFLFGTTSQLQLGVGNQYRGYRNWELSFYWSDRFTVRPGLSLHLGLRYEILTVPQEVNHLVQFVHQTDANNFAPQFGFAWNPGQGKTVLRAGYGVTFGSITIATFNRQASNPPQVQSLVVPAPTLLELRNISSLTPVPGRRSSLNLVGPNFVAPYSHTYNFAVERELPGQALLRMAYLGSRSYKMFTGAIFNRAQPVAGIAPTTGTVNQRRPNPNLLRIFNIINSSIGYLDALQVSVSKRRSRGLAFEARYTWSKAIDTGGTHFADTGSSGDESQTEEIFSDLKGVSSFDTPHSLTFSYSYELPPIRAGQGWLSLLLGKWAVSGTTTFRSGTPFTVFTGSDAPGFGNVDGENNDRPNILNPRILGVTVDHPDTSTSILRQEYFDTNLAPGGRGTLGNRTFRKDGTNNWNFALMKSVPLGEASRKQLQFRAEFYNFLNHAQFSAPGLSVSSPTFGQITNTVNKGRVTQLTLRLLF